MAKLDLNNLEKKYFNTPAKIKKIPRNTDDIYQDLLDIFLYIDGITDNSVSGSVITEFLIQNNHINITQELFLKRLNNTYHFSSSFKTEIEKEIRKQQRKKMTLSDHWDETLESEPHLIGNFFGWIGIIALSLFIGNCGYKAMNEGQYNHPACSALGLKSNWNNTKCY